MVYKLLLKINSPDELLKAQKKAKLYSTSKIDIYTFPKCN